MSFGTFLTSICVSLGIALSGCASIGAGIPGGGGEADTLLINASAAFSRADKAVTALGSAVLSKKDLEERQARIDEINKIPDLKEKEAKLLAEAEEFHAKMLKKLETEQAKFEAAAADAKKKVMIERALLNLIWLALYDANLVNQITSMVSNPSPTIAAQLDKLTHSAELIGRQGKLLGEAMPHIKTLATKVGITAFPVSAAEDPGEIGEI
jgi:hypothetical protein